MNHYHNINNVVKDDISCIEAKMWNKNGQYYGSAFAKEELERLVDCMGAQSSALCYLRKLQPADLPPARWYPRFARIGWKNLVLEDSEGFIMNKDMFCLFDMFVARSFQRQGNGKRLLDYMFDHEKVLPWQIAIDQPTSILLRFFDRQFVFQQDRFIVWKRFMDEARPTAKSGVRYIQPSHTYTSNTRDYLGGLWPTNSSKETLDDHKFVNWHPPIAATPEENYELSPEQKQECSNYWHRDRKQARGTNKRYYAHQQIWFPEL